MKITADAFEAYLKCPTKCWLRAAGESFAGDSYSEWVKSQSMSYRLAETERLFVASSNEDVVFSPSIAYIKLAKWKLAFGLVVQASIDSCVMEAELHAVERVPAEGRGKPAQFIPLRFVFSNKLRSDDKMLLAFDAFVLAKLLEREVTCGKIIHGDNHTTFKLNISGTAGEVRKIIEKIAAMLSSSVPPDHVLNRHCPECEYQAPCRQRAVDSDDLSLLSRMTAKDRQKFRDKGIFTVRQLSYTFRPRRRPKWQRDKPEKYHHSLKALAIRHNKTHIVGNKDVKIEGTPVYLDVEGVPDRDFYYLIGLRVGKDNGAVQYSLWADTIEDERKIWREFLQILQTVENPVVIHYGSFETEFMNRMIKCYGGSALESGKSDNIILFNILSLIHGHLYFPTYSNSLKDIGAWLGFKWSDKSPIGANSIACRFEWENTRNPSLKSRLIAYNSEDCQAAEIVAQALMRLSAPAPAAELTEKSSDSDAVHVKALKRPQRRWGNFVSPFRELEEINATAWWDYQRDRIYVKSDDFNKPCRLRNTRARSSWLSRLPVDKVIITQEKKYCLICNKECEVVRSRKRMLIDLTFGKASVKRRIVDYKFYEYRCPLCQRLYGEPPEFWHESHFGRNLVAYILYETIDLHIPFVTVQKNLSRFFNLNLPEHTLRFIRKMAANGCKAIYDNIFEHLVTGHLLHVDETEVSIRGKPAYVWVFTNLKDVAYLYAAGREGAFLHEMLREFKGVLVTDFYGAYDSLNCAQQKCLIHLIRDLNDEVLSHPYDEDLKAIVRDFASLLKPIVVTIDQRGLKKRFLLKHQIAVNRFYKRLAKMDCQSEAASKCKQRFERNRDKLFTFLKYDGIPWNNNNAEHAVKVFAQIRSIVRGSFTEESVRGYLVMLSICQTCKCSGLDFFEFIRSGEMDIHAFAESQRGHRRRTDNRKSLTADESMQKELLT